MKYNENKNLEYLTKDRIRNFIQRALDEDIGQGDHSTMASISKGTENSACLIAKDNGIIAGVELAVEILNFYDSSLKVDILISDGMPIAYGDFIFKVKGNARSILSCERLVLNCMQRMSGIASYTKKLSDLIAHTKAKILDTRKTTPNFRMCEKWAVHIGGGINHRYGLYDMILLKDNHLDFAGGIKEAISKTKSYLHKIKKNLKIVIEARNLQEVSQVIEIGGVDRILLDNMPIEELKQAVKLIGNKFETEASGGIDECTVASIAETGVNYISVGALTHSAKNIDLSLKASSGFYPSIR